METIGIITLVIICLALFGIACTTYDYSASTKHRVQLSKDYRRKMKESNEDS